MKMKLLTTFMFVWTLLFSFTYGKFEREAELVRLCDMANSCFNGVSHVSGVKKVDNVSDVEGVGDVSDIEGIGNVSDVVGVGDVSDVEGVGSVSDVEGVGDVSDVVGVGNVSDVSDGSVSDVEGVGSITDDILINTIFMRNADMASFCLSYFSCIALGDKATSAEAILPTKGLQNFNIPIAPFCSLLNSCNGTVTNTRPVQKNRQTCLDMGSCNMGDGADEIDSTCCASCSCMDDCGSMDVCCQSLNDLFDPAENDIMECVPVDLEGTVTVNFNMITGCLNGQTCYDDSLEPVSSAATKRIYAHRKCAICNGVTDFEYWSMIAYCDGNVKGLHHFPDHLQLFPKCRLQYLLPVQADLLWYNNFLCDVVQTCNATSVDQSILDGCYNSWAPVFYLSYFFDFTVYANADCVTCNGFTFVQDHYCKKRYITTTRIHPSVLSVYLNMPVVSKYYEESSTNFYNTTLGCVDSGETTSVKEICHNRLCPEGMVVVEGICQYHILAIKDSTVSVQFKLFPVNEVSKNYLLALVRHRQNRKIKRWLRKPCILAFISETKVFVSTTPTDDVEYLIVRIIRSKMSGNFEEEIELMRECLQGYWFVRFRGKTVNFDAILDTYKDYIPGEIPDNEVISTEQTNPKSLDLLKEESTYTYSKASVFIKEVYFCNQVELMYDEIELGVRQIKMLHNDLILGDNAYSMIHTENDTDNEYIIRVCEADYFRTSRNTKQAKTDTNTNGNLMDGFEVHGDNLQSDVFDGGIHNKSSNRATQHHIFWEWFWYIVVFGFGIKTIL